MESSIFLKLANFKLGLVDEQLLRHLVRRDLRLNIIENMIDLLLIESGWRLDIPHAYALLGQVEEVLVVYMT